MKRPGPIRRPTIGINQLFESTLTDVAREIYISPSRLRHLFVEETGLPFRRYVRMLGVAPTSLARDAPAD